MIAFAEGAARDLVQDGETGFLVDDETAMAAAIGRLPSIAPADCRAWVSEHCDIGVVAHAYERAYRAALSSVGVLGSGAALSSGRALASGGAGSGRVAAHG